MVKKAFAWIILKVKAALFFVADKAVDWVIENPKRLTATIVGIAISLWLHLKGEDMPGELQTALQVLVAGLVYKFIQWSVLKRSERKALEEIR